MLYRGLMKNAYKSDIIVQLISLQNTYIIDYIVYN